MRFEPGQHVVFIGDSITDCERRGAHAPYGNGYVSLVRAFITARWPGQRLRWTNRGVSGDTVRHLAARWDGDAIGERPDWLSVMVGINDIWRWYAGLEGEAVPIDEYEKTLRTLLSTAVDRTGCRLILADPYFIEPDRTRPQGIDTDSYASVVAGLSVEFDAVHIATQQAFDAVLASTDPGDWAADQIHPNKAGHAVIAQAYLDAIGG